MPTKSVLYDPYSGDPLLVVPGESPGGQHKLAATSTLAIAHGVFKSAQRTTAGTTIITQPDNGGAIVITDLLISTDRTNATSVSLQFTDDTETINIFTGDSTNAPIALGHGFTGTVKGWKDARLEMVTVGAVTATVMAGYYKIKDGIYFAEWDALR